MENDKYLVLIEIKVFFFIIVYIIVHSHFPIEETVGEMEQSNLKS